MKSTLSLVALAVCVAALLSAGCGFLPGKPASSAKSPPAPQTGAPVVVQADKPQDRALAEGDVQVPRNPGGAPVQPGTPIVASDACGERLHDISGALLLYYAMKHRLPDKLEELHEMPGFEYVKDFTCPDSHKPYIYNPVGILDVEKHTRVIIYDPAPTHHGLRRAISVVEPQGNEALITEVLLLPENWFVLHPPK
ncbi:MAG TPA: hypothetical protein VH518_19075 [Tepidisphaeraceae bacterium]|jgi:hypothetical protein